MKEEMLMRCDVCKVNAATVELHMQLNQKVQEVHLCTQCFNKIRDGVGSPAGASPFSGPSAFGSFGDMFEGFSNGPSSSSSGHASIQTKAPGTDGGFLDQFGVNLSQLAKADRIDPVIGREDEVNRVIEILNRRNKNNPVLIGEPGVGKTAIAEGLAVKIAQGAVPTKLQNKQIYTLDVASLVADTGVRGQFEERMKQLIAELKARSDVMLFIDEIHLLVGAGSAQGSMDAGNILKPALARGELQVIGATTLKEYRQIEKDAALERRFQPVLVGEPTVEKTIEILNGLRSKYEQYHQVKFTDEAIRACAVLSHRYITDRFLPDKAIDLLDEAGSKVNLASDVQDPSSLKARLERVVYEKQQATKAENYERAAQLRQQELNLRAQMEQQQPSVRPEVRLEDIQRIVEEKTGIPVRKLQDSEQSRLRDLEGRLSQKVIGQAEAVQKVAKAIRRSRAGLKASTRPIGTFLFVGPTGVGKTELAKALAEELFGSKDAMIRLDMSEYMERHSVSKIIGSPPGYVGHDEAGQLTEQVRRNPYSLILLDEIEKAHPDVQHIFLQIMEDGRLTDSQGKTVSFKDSIIIMTSNAGVSEKRVHVGFGRADGEQEHSVLSSLGGYFKPEFLNRVDGVVQFKSLTQEHLMKIVDIMLQEVMENLEEQHVKLTCTRECKAKLAAMGYHPAFGARPLRRVIQEHVEDKIADVLLGENEVHSIVLDVKDDEVAVKATA